MFDLFPRRARLHHRPDVATVEDAVVWLLVWDDARFCDQARNPAYPWKRTRPNDVRSIAESLLKLRALYDAGVCRG